MFQEFVRFKNFDNVYWSLTVELAFYLNVAWLFVLGWHKQHQRVVTGWMLLSCAYALALHDPGLDARPLYSIYLALEFSPYFSIGIVFHDVIKRGWSWQRALLIGLAIVTVYLLHGFTEAIKSVVVVALIATALTGWIAFSVSRITLWLGTISYSLYLIHRNVGFALLSWRHEHGLGPVISILLVTILALAAASLITYTIEQPTQRFIRKAWAARTAHRQQRE